MLGQFLYLSEHFSPYESVGIMNNYNNSQMFYCLLCWKMSGAQQMLLLSPLLIFLSVTGVETQKVCISRLSSPNYFTPQRRSKFFFSLWMNCLFICLIMVRLRRLRMRNSSFPYYVNYASLHQFGKYPKCQWKNEWTGWLRGYYRSDIK